VLFYMISIGNLIGNPCIDLYPLKKVHILMELRLLCFVDVGGGVDRGL